MPALTSACWTVLTASLLLALQSMPTPALLWLLAHLTSTTMELMIFWLPSQGRTRLSFCLVCPQNTPRNTRKFQFQLLQMLRLRPPLHTHGRPPYRQNLQVGSPLQNLLVAFLLQSPPSSQRLVQHLCRLADSPLRCPQEACPHQDRPACQRPCSLSLLLDTSKPPFAFQT